VGRLRALSFAVDALILACLVDVPALLVLGLAFLFLPEARLDEIGAVAFLVFLVAFLLRDTKGGLSRKWLGFKIEDAAGRPPGWARSLARNLPLIVPGWNLWEAVSVARRGERPRSIDRLLGLQFRELP
jgi:hypothetical protein